MKIVFAFVVLFLTISSFAQTEKADLKKLKSAFAKISYWRFDKYDDENSYDSLEKANQNFQDLLLKITRKPKSINYDYKDLDSLGLVVLASQDSNFKVFSWNTWLGGTMRIYQDVKQYKVGEKVFSKAATDTVGLDNGAGGVMYYDMMQIITDSSTYYLLNSVAVGSSALRYYEVDVYTIENGKLNENAKLIKTKSGVKHSVGYDLDFASSVNHNFNHDIETSIVFDKTKQEFSFPVIADNGRITNKKIVYKFTGKYFERVQN